MIREDGWTDGHVVVWTPTFGRLVDPMVCQHPAFRRACQRIGHALTGSVTTPVGEGRDALLRWSRERFTVVGPLMVSWMLFPQSTSWLEHMLDRHAAAVEKGGLVVAHAALDLLVALACQRDLSGLDRVYPQLAGLLAGSAHLPALDWRATADEEDVG